MKESIMEKEGLKKLIEDQTFKISSLEKKLLDNSFMEEGNFKQRVRLK